MPRGIPNKPKFVLATSAAPKVTRKTTATKKRVRSAADQKLIARLTQQAADLQVQKDEQFRSMSEHISRLQKSSSPDVISALTTARDNALANLAIAEDEARNAKAEVSRLTDHFRVEREKDANLIAAQRSEISAVHQIIDTLPNSPSRLGSFTHFNESQRFGSSGQTPPPPPPMSPAVRLAAWFAHRALGDAPTVETVPGDAFGMR